MWRVANKIRNANFTYASWCFWSSIKAFVAFSSIVPSTWYNFFMRSSAGSWNGTKHVFNNLSTNNLKQKKSYLQLQAFYDQEWQDEKM
jgi:hypothetical protein